MNILEITLWVELFLFVLLVLGSPVELVLHFWALMNSARVRDLPDAGLSKTASIVGGYLLIRGYLLDFIVNAVWMSVYLWEWPRQLTVTDRLNRHATGTGFRHDRCELIQVQLCKWFDTKHADGNHR